MIIKCIACKDRIYINEYVYYYEDEDVILHEDCIYDYFRNHIRKELFKYGQLNEHGKVE